MIGKNQVEYQPRLVDDSLKLRLEARGAVLIEGPKWCGKTTTALQQSKSFLTLADPNRLEQNLLLSQIAPEKLLEGDAPRLIDEWQVAPNLWDAVRYEVDSRGQTGQFILTGSAVPADTDKMIHSGTGRISRLRMRPMTLSESGDCSKQVSLEQMFAGGPVLGEAKATTLEQMAFLLCRGGWPQSLQQSQRAALLQGPDYLESVAQTDMSRVDGIQRDPELVRQLLRSYARHSASQVSVTTIVADLAQSLNPSEKTVRQYLNALQQIFVIEDAPAWNPNLRSKTAVRTTPTRHFIDPSLAAAALGATPHVLVNDLETFGLLFESLCVRDLRVYSEFLGGRLYHYRDSAGAEVDAVIVLPDGRYGLIEIKLGGQSLIDAGAAGLTRFARKLDTGRMPHPSFLAVVVATGDFAYQRPDDGVMVVPITALTV